MRRSRHEFRASWLIRLGVLVGLCAWLTMGAIAASLGLGVGAYFSIVFFILFFCGFAVYYWSMAYVVDEHGVTYRGATDFVYVPWEDIREVKSSDLPLGGWIVNARGGGIVLSKFVRQRTELVDLIIARAGLFPT